MRGAALALWLIAALAAADTATADQAAPAFELPLLGDETRSVSLGDFRGEVVYVDFWAAWCRPCRDALPFFDALQAELDEAGFRVLGVNIDEDPADGLRFLEETPVSYPVVSDRDGTVLKAYGVKTMPTGFLVDRDGRIVLKHRGFREKHKAKLATAIREAVRR